MTQRFLTGSGPWQGWFKGGLACLGTVRKTECEVVRECANVGVIRERQIKGKEISWSRIQNGSA